jgi:MarR family transcriptional regulator, transcriptional regulator for hemolysin
MKKNSLPLTLFETALAWRHELDKRLKPLGLSQAKWRVLAHLSLSEKPLNQTELAKRLGVEGPTLVGLLDRLAKDDWIERVDDNADRRSKAVHLTAKAKVALKKIHATADQLCDELLINAPKDKVATCIEVLKFITSSLEAMA